MVFSSRRSRNRHSANPNPKLHSPHIRRKISPHDGRTAQQFPMFAGSMLPAPAALPAFPGLMPPHPGMFGAGEFGAAPGGFPHMFSQAEHEHFMSSQEARVAEESLGSGSDMEEDEGYVLDVHTNESNASHSDEEEQTQLKEEVEEEEEHISVSMEEETKVMCSPLMCENSNEPLDFSVPKRKCSSPAVSACSTSSASRKSDSFSMDSLLGKRRRLSSSARELKTGIKMEIPEAEQEPEQEQSERLTCRDESQDVLNLSAAPLLMPSLLSPEEQHLRLLQSQMFAAAAAAAAQQQQQQQQTAQQDSSSSSEGSPPPMWNLLSEVYRSMLLNNNLKSQYSEMSTSAISV